MMTNAKQTTLVQDLRELADFLEAHLEVGPPSSWIEHLIFVHTPEELTTKLKALIASGKRVVKREWGNDKEHLEFSIHFGSIKLGVNVRKEALGCQKVKVQREVEEWQCPESFVQEFVNRPTEVEVP